MRVYYTHNPLKESSWQLIMWVWRLHLHMWPLSEFFLQLIQCHLLAAIEQLMCFSMQTTLATGPSSPRSQVTAFFLWAQTTSRFLLIAGQKETHLHIIGMCKPQGETTVFNIKWKCTESMLSVFFCMLLNLKLTLNDLKALLLHP